MCPLFDGAMKGRTMYVVPYVMGPLGSPFSKVGVEITDSPYVVANMRIMTRMGQAALDQLGASEDFVPGLHSLGDLSPDRRFIVHFPEERTIWSVGSGYGGNALLGKKCFALRIASTLARDQGWLAEHMLILELELPGGEIHYVAAAFPSACGKTNLAMLVSPLEAQGYKVRTRRRRHRLAAARPRRAAVGRQPGGRLLRRRCPAPDPDTNPNALATIAHDTIFTNVAVTPDGVPVVGGQGRARRPRTSSTGRASPGTARRRPRTPTPASPSPRASARRSRRAGRTRRACRSRRSSSAAGARALAPLVFESRDWDHGVFVGATMGSETTAAATGQVGVVRRDPMAMLPFCGYNMGDYFAHWLQHGPRRSRTRPRSSTSTGSAPTSAAASSGRASARTCACCCG